MRAIDTNPFLESVREAYRKSPAWQRLHGGEPLEGAISNSLPREPGEDRNEVDVGIPRDPLEQEFLDRDQP